MRNRGQSPLRDLSGGLFFSAFRVWPRRILRLTIAHLLSETIVAQGGTGLPHLADLRQLAAVYEP